MDARKLLPIAACLTVGACGSSAPAKHVAPGCDAAVASALDDATNAHVTPHSAPRQYAITGCSYAIAGGTTVKVTDDHNPQPLTRFERAVVETDQNALWSTTPALAPRTLDHIAMGADWVPQYQQLIAGNNRSFFTIVVTGSPARAQALAVVAIKATLRTRSGS